jgi:transposase-like protein
VCKLKQGEETMPGKAKRAQYALEFKLEAVRLVKAGQSMAAVAATLGVVETDAVQMGMEKRQADRPRVSHTRDTATPR